MACQAFLFKFGWEKIISYLSTGQSLHPSCHNSSDCSVAQNGNHQGRLSSLFEESSHGIWAHLLCPEHSVYNYWREPSHLFCTKENKVKGEKGQTAWTF